MNHDTTEQLAFRSNEPLGPFEPDAIRRARKPEGWLAREKIIRQAEKYNETCFRCGEQRLMWKLDYADGEVKLWIPYSFHVCPDGHQAKASSPQRKDGTTLA